MSFILDIDIPRHDPQGHEQEGRRPCLLILDFGSLQRLTFPKVLIAPITKRPMKKAALHVPLKAGDGGLKLGGTLLLDQIRVVDASRIHGQYGKLEGDALERSRAALKNIFDKALE
jgi:mRNA interferase MazF